MSNDGSLQEDFLEGLTLGQHQRRPECTQAEAWGSEMVNVGSERCVASSQGRVAPFIAAMSGCCFILQLVSSLKEENTLLKQEKETLNHRIVEQAKEMTGKALEQSYCTLTTLHGKFSKLHYFVNVNTTLSLTVKMLKLSSVSLQNSERQDLQM